MPSCAHVMISTARQRDEPVRKLAHRRLADVHRLDDAQLGEPVVRDLALDERARDDADDFPAGRERRVGRLPHQPDVRPSVDEAGPAARDGGAERPRGRRVRGAVAGPGAAEHANASNRHGSGGFITTRRQRSVRSHSKIIAPPATSTPSTLHAPVLGACGRSTAPGNEHACTQDPGVTFDATNDTFFQAADFNPPHECFAAPCAEGTAEELNLDATDSYDAIVVKYA
jgi:hypothetical protein